MIPKHVLDELNLLTQAQKQKFHELSVWAGGGEITGSSLPIDYNKIMDMVRTMGEEPITPAEPDKTVNHDWQTIAPKIKE